MPAYYIHFKAQRGITLSEHTRVVNIALPLEYESDIVAVQDWAAKELGADSTMLISWRELKGRQRPNEGTEGAPHG